MKHPCLRVASVLSLHVSVLDELEQVMRSIGTLMPVPIIDVEIVGSYSNNSGDKIGAANLRSDLDLAMPAENFEDQMKIRAAYYGKDPRLQRAIDAILLPYREKWGIDLEFNPVIPWNKNSPDYATFSLFERKLYGTPLDMEKFWLRFSNYTQTYVPTPYDVGGHPVDDIKKVPAFSGPMKVGVDQFADQVDKWRAIYGDKFLETALIDGELYDAGTL